MKHYTVFCAQFDLTMSYSCVGVPATNIITNSNNPKKHNNCVLTKNFNEEHFQTRLLNMSSLVIPDKPGHFSILAL